jgi:hypothetical protein
MIGFFRKIRRKLANENQFVKYSRYAVGEIMLVVVGILIALQINNWNESRKQQNEFKNILYTISQDLKQDTLVANNIIKYYKDIEISSLKIINKKINRYNYKEHPEAVNLVTRYRQFAIQTKGFEMVKDYSSKNRIRNDSVFSMILQFYTPFLEIINDSNEILKNEVLSNVESYKNYDWFVDWALGKYSSEMLVYFTESEEYRKQVATQNLLVGKNHLLYISSYKTRAVKLINYIDKYLKENH